MFNGYFKFKKKNVKYTALVIIKIKKSMNLIY